MLYAALVSTTCSCKKKEKRSVLEQKTLADFISFKYSFSLTVGTQILPGDRVEENASPASIP